MHDLFCTSRTHFLFLLDFFVGLRACTIDNGRLVFFSHWFVENFYDHGATHKSGNFIFEEGLSDID